MRILVGFIVLALMWAFQPMIANSQSAVALNVEQPVVRAVLFRADWCANCHILEPVLEKAMAQAAGLPVELVVLDFTNAETWDRSIEVALDHDVVQVYNAYAGITGMVVLTSVATGERIDCFDRTFSAPTMVHAMKRAVSTARGSTEGKPIQVSAFCPAGRAPL